MHNDLTFLFRKPVYLLLGIGLLCGAHAAAAQTVFISEIMADNGSTLLDEDGNASDWIELYNNSDAAVDLTGWYLSDDDAEPTQWQFPSTTLAARSFLVVFASGEDRAVSGAELHTNFKLSADGEQVLLVQADGSTLEDQLVFTALEEDMSYGRGFSSSSVEPVYPLAAGAPCTAHIPTGETDADGWKALSFDDSGWLSGTTGVGYETGSGYEGLIGLDVGAMYDVNASVYVRVPFTIDDPAAVSSLTLNMKYDDAFTAYINGTEAAVSDLAPAALEWNSEADGYHADGSAVVFEAFSIDSSISLLQAGENVLAVHGLNDKTTSSDLIFVPQLEAVLFDGGIDDSAVGILSTASPGSANTAVAYADIVSTPVTYPERGFYDAPVQVCVSNTTAGAAIRYTLDGSAPTEDSTEYTGPVTISSTTCFRVGAFIDGWKSSYPRTDTYIFVDDTASRSKTTDTINGQTLEYGMDADVLAETYYDASTQLVTVQDALKAIPSISLSTDYDNLYAADSGIYVNATEKWEVPASAELINPDGSEGFHINAGLRIRGGASRTSSNPKHSFRLFFRDDYGEGKLSYALFEDEGVDEFKKVDLRSAQNYSWSKDNDSRNTFLRDVFARDSAGEMEQPYTRSRYYHLYVNAEYWGLFMTEERPVADFAESYFGGDADDYDVIKVIGRDDDGAYSIEATDGTLDAYYRLYAAAMAGFTDNADYFAVMGLNAAGEPDAAQEKLLDVENLIDHQLMIYYTAASDNGITKFIGNNGKLNNMYAIYNRVDPDGFKWILHDCEHSLDTTTDMDRTGPFTNSNFTLPEYFNGQTLHEKLSANEEYRIKFADRVYKHMYNGGALVRTNSEARLDCRAAQIDRAIVANAARWGSTDLDRDTWTNAAAVTRAWLSRTGDRCNEVISYLDGDGLIPSILPPLFDVNGGLVSDGTTIAMTRQEMEDPAISSTPYYGTPHAVPGTIEAEDFDLDGAGIAYSDTTSANKGGEYRTSEGVDIQECDEGGYNVGWIVTGEWINYTVDVAEAGDYEISVRAATPNDDAAFHIEVDGVDAAGSIVIGNTTGYQVWADEKVSVGLGAGEQVITFVVDNGGFNINYIEFTDLQTDLLPIASDPADDHEEATAQTFYYTTDGTDPRAVGGAIAGLEYTGPVSITRPTHLQARSRTADGEWSALAEADFWTPDIPLAVTEVMYHAPDGDAHDFIEIQNISSESVTLKGYKLDDAVDFKFKNAPQTALAPGEFLVTVDDIDAFRATYPTNGVNIAGEYSGDLSNSGEEVDLEFRSSDMITFEYSDARNWPQAADGAGHSLVPVDSAMDDQEDGSLNYGGNWRASTYTNGSPGFADPALPVTVLLNEITAHTDTEFDEPFDSNDQIELYNPAGTTADISGWGLSDDKDDLFNYTIPDGTVIEAGGYLVFDEDDFHSDRVNGFGLNKAGEQVYLSDPARGVVDAVRFKGQENGDSFGRYPDGEAAWIRTEPTPAEANQPAADTVRISELMYNPAQSGNDFEYIRIKNTGTAAHTFENSVGTYRIDGGVEFYFPAGTVLAPNEDLWILSFNPTNTVKLALFCAAYGLDSSSERILGGYSGSLSDQGERVALERPQASDDPDNPDDISWVVLDELYYFDQAPWPESADGTGYPLVRQDLLSWSAASDGDSDADRINDAWELSYFGSLDQILSDWDADGQSNLEEYIADTDPTNAASRFITESISGTTLNWTPAAGRTYSVYWSGQLTGPFELIAFGLTGGSYSDADRGRTGFYRILVELE